MVLNLEIARTLTKNISSNQIVKTLFSRYFCQKSRRFAVKSYFHDFLQEKIREMNVVL